MTIRNGSAHWLLTAALLITAFCAKAETIQEITASNYLKKHAEFSASGGFSDYRTSNTNLVVSPFETDSIRVNSRSVNGAWKLGIGIYFFEDQLSSSFFKPLLLELNLYQTSTTLKGNVWQYQLPQFNNYTFSAPVKSTRLMLDVKPTLVTWHSISPYAILGVGATWNTASYSEAAYGAGIDPASVMSLSNNTDTQFAWDLGAGFKFPITKNISATAEYIYAFLGDGSPGYGINLSKAPSFSLQNQSLLFGLTVKP